MRPCDLPLRDLGEAAKAAALITSLEGSAGEQMAAKHAIVEILGSRLNAKDVASVAHLGISTLRRFRRKPAPKDLVEAIRRQLGFREARRHRNRYSKTPQHGQNAS
ncbi:MAG: hypothetical protein KAI47_03345 [Deltaproteobacteria bacterium]|nr:hypothetical protein [Deltaproteobacteria bacterium]